MIIDFTAAARHPTKRLLVLNILVLDAEQRHAR